MMKALLFTAAAALVGCAAQPTTTPLSDLKSKFGDTHVEVVANGQLAILLHVAHANESNCPLLGDDVVATFDGQRMGVSNGYAIDASGCYPIAFTFELMPASSIAAWERTTSGSQLVVADHSETWNIDTHALFSNNFVDDTANSQIVWNDVSQITFARVSPGVATQIKGNTIQYPPGTKIDWVSATSHPIATRCAGPALCTIDLTGERQLGPINP